ncbi:hypothetical protein CO046_01250 [Candidatus Peregrinibacteria bacterium CG_4_9_14_0_2_um_filter_53_11]|nr:MAG: hypothetical protein CO046_01250 [Candidatus Peregrinibacteria bacterium CG_4_9_14_0_2_um_filter_53_11]
MARSGTLISDTQNVQLIDLINKGIAYAIIVAGFLSVVFIFIGGISFILSGGQEDKIKQAVSTIRYAIIGLIVTILAVIIVNALGNIIGISTTEYISFSEIVRIIQDISDSIRSSGGGSGGQTLR